MLNDSYNRGWRGGDLPKKIILKVGSALLTPDGPLGGDGLRRLTQEINILQQHGVKVSIVSSGAIAQGRLSLGITQRPNDLSYAQALAALGQPLLMKMWAESFLPTKVAQVLLTMSDVLDPLRLYNARRALNALDELGIIAIGNENDTVATDEIKFGDNDRLGAYLAHINGAELLILYTQVNGLYTENPLRNPQAKRLECVENLQEVFSYAEGTSQDGWGTGGMKTKLEATKIAHQVGTSVLIAHGATSLLQLLDHPSLGTLIPAPHSSADALLMRWPLHGQIELSVEGFNQLIHGKSIDLKSCISVHGQFSRGNLIELTKDSIPMGRALVAYSADECIQYQQKPQSPSFIQDGALIYADDWVSYTK